MVDACGKNGGEDACDSAIEAGNRAADIPTTGFIVGGVGVAVGTALFFTASGPKSTKTAIHSRPDVHPWVGWRSLGVRGEF